MTADSRERDQGHLGKENEWITTERRGRGEKMSEERDMPDSPSKLAVWCRVQLSSNGINAIPAPPKPPGEQSQLRGDNHAQEPGYYHLGVCAQCVLPDTELCFALNNLCFCA